MLSEFYILHPTPHHQRPTTVFTHLHLHPSFSKDFIANAAGIAFLFVAILLAFHIKALFFKHLTELTTSGRLPQLTRLVLHLGIVFVASSDCLC